MLCYACADFRACCFYSLRSFANAVKGASLLTYKAGSGVDQIAPVEIKTHLQDWNFGCPWFSRRSTGDVKELSWLRASFGVGKHLCNLSDWP